MALYMISYDLRGARDYAPLLKQLRDWKCVHPLESMWLGGINGTAMAVHKALRALMDDDDGLLVIEIKPDTDWAFNNIETAAESWIEKRLNE